MSASRRQRLVESVWAPLTGIVTKAPARPLLDALRTSSTIRTTGDLRLVTGGRLFGIASGNELLLQATVDVGLDALLHRPVSPQMPLAATVQEHLDRFLALELDVLSQLMEASVAPITDSAVAPYPDDLPDAISAARVVLGQGPLDLLLGPASLDRLGGTREDVQVRLRGGRILPSATGWPIADGLLTPRLERFAAVMEAEPLTLDWDATADGVQLILTERFRVWRAEKLYPNGTGTPEPNTPAVNFVISSP